MQIGQDSATLDGAQLHPEHEPRLRVQPKDGRAAALGRPLLANNLEQTIAAELLHNVGDCRLAQAGRPAEAGARHDRMPAKHPKDEFAIEIAGDPRIHPSQLHAVCPIDQGAISFARRRKGMVALSGNARQRARDRLTRQPCAVCTLFRSGTNQIWRSSKEAPCDGTAELQPPAWRAHQPCGKAAAPAPLPLARDGDHGAPVLYRTTAGGSPSPPLLAETRGKGHHGSQNGVSARWGRSRHALICAWRSAVTGRRPPMSWRSPFL